MRASKRAFFKRAGAACAAAAVLLAGTFTASSATAAPSSEPTTSSTSSAVATAVPTETASLPDGMAEAVKRDLNMSVEEFNAQAVIADEAAIVQAEIIKADPAAVVSVAGDTINVVTSNTAAAKAAASSTKVNVTPAAPATLVSTVVHADLDTVYADYIAAFGTKNLQSIMTNAKGEVVIRTGVAATASPSVSVRPFTAPAAPALDSFAAEYSNVVVADASGAATALAENVVSGQGYASPAGGGYVDLCSIGWNGFNKAGENAVISAGHCTNDGVLTNTWLTDPSKDNAGNPTDPGLGIGSVLGTFGFSQFGGPNNSPATGVNSPQEGNIGTDVSVIDNINPALNPIATVTDWKSPSNLGASGTKVTGVSTALVGTAICKSGRTTGWSCGTVAEVGYFMVRGLQDPTSDDDNRAVAGFGSNNLRVDHGDSGGPVLAGGNAVGITSAGNDEGWSFTADLKTALAATDGYTVRIFLGAPKITVTAPVYRGGPVTGTTTGAPAGSTVSVTINGVTTEAAIGSDGAWSVGAPNKLGTFSVTAVVKNGFSTSAAGTASLEVVKETLAAPAVTSPANDSVGATPVTTIAGSGKPGATIVLAGDVTAKTVVDASGNWSYTIPESFSSIGGYTVNAKQTLAGWNDSATITSNFTIAPVAPAIVTPTNGQKFAFNEGPTVISGTNLADATVQLTVNGKKYTAVVDGTSWSVTLDAALATGPYTVTAVQLVGDDESLISTSTFEVQAEPQLKPTKNPAAAPTTAPAKVPSNKGDLAKTGASGSTLMLGGAGGLLLLGGAAFLLIRRRSAN